MNSSNMCFLDSKPARSGCDLSFSMAYGACCGGVSGAVFGIGEGFDSIKEQLTLHEKIRLVTSKAVIGCVAGAFGGMLGGVLMSGDTSKYCQMTSLTSFSAVYARYICIMGRVCLNASAWLRS